MLSGQSSDVQLRYLDGGGQWVTTTLTEVDGAAVVRGQPVRAFPTYKGQRNYPGWLSTATTSSLVGYESLLERGVDISDQQPRQLTPTLQQGADVVVTVGEAEVDPLPGPAYETWQIDEPWLRGIDGPERMRLVRDDINRHVEDLHRRLAVRCPPLPTAIF